MNRKTRIVLILLALITLGLTVTNQPGVSAQVPPPDLTVSKTHSGAFKVGFGGTYTVTVTNQAAAGATTGNVQVVDLLPIGMSLAGSTFTLPNGSYTCSTTMVGQRQQITCDSTGMTLNPGSSAILTFAVDIAQAAFGTGKINNVSVNTPGETNTVNNSATDTVDVAGSPDLIISKTHNPLTFTVNTDGDFILTVQNQGTAPTTQTITVTDNLAANLIPQSADDVDPATMNIWNCSITGQLVACTNTAPLGAFGQAAPIRITVRPNAAGTYTNGASVSLAGGEEPPGATGNNTTNPNDSVTVTAQPDLTVVSKTPNPATFIVGVPAQFTIRVQNVGAGDAQPPVTVTDTLDTGLTFVQAGSGGDGFTCSSTNGTNVTCSTSGAFTAGAIADIVIPVTVGQAAIGTRTNNATVSATGDSNPLNNTLVNPISVTVNWVDLQLTKTHSPATLLVGTNATFSFQVQNIATGPNASPTLGNITLTDTLPTGLTFVNGSTTGAGWACGASGQDVTCTYTGAAINPGSSSTVTFQATVGTTTASPISNTGLITTTGDAPNGPFGANNTSTDTPITVQRPDLIVSKAALGTFAVGQPGDFQIIVTNQGSGPTSTVVSITDTMPANFTNTVGTAPTSDPSWTCGAYNAGTRQITCTNNNVVNGSGGSLPSLILRTTPTNQGTFTNSVTVTNAEDVNTGNNSTTAQVTVNPPPPPVLSITKTHVGTNFVVNQTGTYHIDIQNVGQGATVANPPIVVTDILPSSFNFVSASGTNWNCTPTAPQTAPPPVQVQCTWTGGIVPGGSNAALNQITIQVTPTTTLNSPFSNTATVTGGGSVTASSTDIVPVTGAAGPDLTITKTHATNFTTAPSTPGTYTITVSNAGTVDSSGQITVSDTLPNGFTYVSGSGTGWTCPTAPQSNPIVCTTNAVVTANGGTAPVLSIQAQATIAGTNFVNTATVTGGGDVNNLNNTANDQTTVTANPLPDVGITKNHTGNFTAGQQGQYTVTVRNIGNATTPAGYMTTVTDTLPGGMTFVAASSGGVGWTCSANGATPQVVTCTNPTPMAAGASQNPLTITVQVPANAPSSVTNTVSVNAPTGDPNTANNTASDPTTIVGVVDISILKSHSGNFQVNTPASYSITVQNIGGATSTGTITVTDTIPAGLNVTGASGPNWTCTIAGQDVTCTRSASFPIGGGGSSVITINVTPTQNGNVTNIANVSGGGDTNPTNNQAQDPTIISTGPVADLSITKVHNGTFVTGQNGTYTLTVRNVGTGTASAPIVASDNLPAGLTFVAAGSSPLCSASGQQVTCTSLNSLAAGGQIPFTIQVAITAAANTTLTNTATVTPPSGDPNSANDSSTDQVTIATAPPVSQGNSTITAFPTTVAADGFTQSTITVTLRDTTGAAVPNRQVTLSTTSGSIPAGVTVFGGTTGTTNASGVVTFQVASSIPQTVNFTAQIGAPENFTISNSAGGSTVNFVSPTGLSPTLSTASANPTSIPADNTTTSTISGTIRTNLNVGAAGVSVTISGNPSTGVTVSPGTTVTTDANGNYSFTVKSTTAQTTTFTITATNGVSNITLSTQPTVTFTSNATATPGGGAVDAGKSSFVSSHVSIPADNITTATFTATLRNSSGGAVTGVTVTVSCNPTLTGMTITPNNNGVSDSNGVATFTVRSVTQGGPVTCTAVAGGVTISQTAQISFTAPGTAPVVNPNLTLTPGTPGTPGTGTPGAQGVALLAAPSNGPNIGIVRAFRLRVRTGPGLRYPVIGLLKLGTRVILLARIPRGTWFMIQLENGQTGWVSSGYIRVARLAFRHLPIVDPRTLPPPGAIPAVVPTPTPTKTP